MPQSLAISPSSSGLDESIAWFTASSLHLVPTSINRPGKAWVSSRARRFGRGAPSSSPVIPLRSRAFSAKAAGVFCPSDGRFRPHHAAMLARGQIRRERSRRLGKVAVFETFTAFVGSGCSRPLTPEPRYGSGVPDDPPGFSIICPPHRPLPGIGNGRRGAEVRTPPSLRSPGRRREAGIVGRGSIRGARRDDEESPLPRGAAVPSNSPSTC